MSLSSAALVIISLFIFAQLIDTQSPVRLMNSFHLFGKYMRQDQSESRYEYSFVEGAKGLTRDGALASFRTFKSSDGVTVFARTEFFRSASEMKNQFETKAKSFSQIIERTDMEDINGNVTGERIVAKHPADEKERDRYSIMWTHGIKISYIESTSLNHALDFEKKFYKSLLKQQLGSWGVLKQ